MNINIPVSYVHDIINEGSGVVQVSVLRHLRTSIEYDLVFLWMGKYHRTRFLRKRDGSTVIHAPDGLAQCTRVRPENTIVTTFVPMEDDNV